jgi:hypothetical protein
MTSMKDESNQNARYTQGPMLPIERDAARGFRFSHIMLHAILRQNNESVRLIEELNKLLIAHGITSDVEWKDALEKSVRS